MSIKSCLDCPALLDAGEAKKLFGAEKSAPMCSRFGHILGELGTDNVYKEAATKLASGCTSYGHQPASVPPVDVSASWFTPRPELLEPKPDVLNSCVGCKNYDEPNSACAATGRIILSNRLRDEATGCAWSEIRPIGEVAKTVGQRLSAYGTERVVFVRNASVQPPQEAAKPTPKKRAPRRQKNLDPMVYSSDAPVTEEHKKQGIKSWIRHTTQRGKEYYLPIFESSFFGEDAQYIPAWDSGPNLYIDHAGLFDEFAVQVYKKDHNLVLIGEPGVGKTDGVEYLAGRMNMPFMRLPYNDLSEPEQFLGQPQYDPVRGTYFETGLLPEWWTKPGFLLSDEPNLAPEAIMQVYRSMNDSSRTLTINREHFRRHDYCFHIMAINPHWDFRNIGAKPLASADSRRLSFFWMPNPDNVQLRAIINRSVEKLDGAAPDKGLVDIILKIGKDLREMSKEGTLPDFWTVSQEIKVARLVDDFGLEGAYRRAYFNYIAPEDAEPAMAAIKTHVPYGSDWA